MPVTRGTAVPSTGPPTWVRSDLKRVFHIFTSSFVQTMDVLRLIWLCSFKDSKQWIYTSGGIAFETSDANTKKLWVS